MNLNGTEYFYVRNAQGDVIALVDKNGVTVAKYVYDTWGKLVSIKDGNDNDVTNVTTSVGYKNPYRYRGYRYDTETGLYYCNSRYYSPEWGRFINADALVGQVGDLLSHNMFAYCGNNPVSRVDPTGRDYIDYIKAVLQGAADACLTIVDPPLGAERVAAKLGLEVAGEAAVVRFSQSSIGRTFGKMTEHGGQLVDDLIQGLKSGSINADDIPAIRIFEQDGKIYTLDNRRLYAFQQAGIEKIKAVWATAEEVANEAWKFNPIDDGLSIKVRGS